MRPARREDAESIEAIVQAGFETYRRFAPPWWRPPPPASGFGERLLAAGVWAQVAESRAFDPREAVGDGEGEAARQGAGEGDGAGQGDGDAPAQGHGDAPAQGHGDTRGRGEIVGIVSFMPALSELGRVPQAVAEPVPGLAHFWQLFVSEPWWGTGVADELHAAARDEMRSRGYERARLWTPSGQRRAHRFYARRGWRRTGNEMNVNDLGLPLTEFVLELADG